MALAISCPHCGERPVEAVRSAWYVRGVLVVNADRGTRTWVGCDACTRRLVLQNLGQSAIFGWWALPAVLVQNLASAYGSPDPEDLSRYLACQGIDIDHVVADPEGRSPADRALVQSVTAVLHEITWADGSADAREIDVGVQVATRVLGDLVTPTQMAEQLGRPACAARLDADGIGPDGLLLLLKAACAVAAADGRVDDGEVAVLRGIGRRLDLPDELVEQFVAQLHVDSTQSAAVRASAAEVLGVAADACECEARTALRRRLLACGELGCPEASAEAREKLLGAFKRLVTAA